MATLRNGLTPLSITHPDLVKEWDYERNALLLPTDVSAGSNKKVWWKCELNHSYSCTVYHRAMRGMGCPYCSGKKVLKGFNDLATCNPALAEEWDYEKNTDIFPDSISLGSNKKVWWKCKEGHSWFTDPNNRSRGRGCPVCAVDKRKQSLAKTLLSLESTKKLNDYPELLKEWDYKKNHQSPYETLSGSQTKVWWICSVCGKSWLATVSNRVRGSGCPQCKKYSRTSFPEQAIYYYLSKIFTNVYNGYTECFDNKMELDIYVPDIKTGIEYDGTAFHTGPKAESEMEKKYQICKNNNIRLIRVSEFDNHTQSYDACFVRKDNSDSSLSAVIGQLIEFISGKQTSVDVVRDRPEIMKQYITILHEKSISTRYPEVAKKWDIEKNQGLRPDQVNSFSNKKYWWKCSLGHSYLATPINEVFNTKSCPICTNHRVLQGFNDLATKLPEIAKEWDIERNYPINATDVMFTSSKKYWWKCPNGHSYKTGINNRYYGKTGCPFCSNSKVLTGYNDLATRCPDLLDEWNYERNKDIKPEEIIYSTHQKVWWKCKKGHEWVSTVDTRTGKYKTGCPYCSNHKVLTGYNDLSTLWPSLIEEWDYKKNKDISPDQITAGTPRKVWWKCKTCGNEWRTSVASRTGDNKTGCPVCGYKVKMKETRKKRLQAEEKTLDRLYPDIAKEWDYEKNELKPSEVSPGANLKVWWLCKNGHSYQSWLNDKTGIHKVGCPVCNRKRLLTGVNDLETLFPDIAKDWDYEKNGDLKPSCITAQNGKKVWWKCKEGHSWDAIISARTGPNKTGCPYCSNKKVLQGYNDLETKYPDLCKEWNYDKNDILPSQVVYGSGKLVWWKCPKGHEYQAKIAQRIRGTGCQLCYYLRGKRAN